MTSTARAHLKFGGRIQHVADSLLERARSEGLSSPWSIAELELTDPEFEDFKTWIGSRTLAEWKNPAGGAISGDASVALVLLTLFAEETRRHGTEGEIWRNQKWREFFPADVGTYVFGVTGAHLSQAVKEAFGELRDTGRVRWSTEGQHYLNTVFLQFGFSLQGASERLANWLRYPEQAPGAVKALLARGPTRSESFAVTWDVLRQVQWRQLTRERAIADLEQFSPWISDANQIVEAAACEVKSYEYAAVERRQPERVRREQLTNINEQEAQRIDEIVFGPPRLLWSSTERAPSWSLPLLVDDLEMTLLGRRRRPSGREFRLTGAEADREPVWTVECHFGGETIDASFFLWDPDDDLTFFDLASGKALRVEELHGRDVVVIAHADLEFVGAHSRRFEHRASRFTFLHLTLGQLSSGQFLLEGSPFWSYSGVDPVSSAEHIRMDVREGRMVPGSACTLLLEVPDTEKLECVEVHVDGQWLAASIAVVDDIPIEDSGIRKTAQATHSAHFERTPLVSSMRVRLTVRQRDEFRRHFISVKLPLVGVLCNENGNQVVLDGSRVWDRQELARFKFRAFGPDNDDGLSFYEGRRLIRAASKGTQTLGSNDRLLGCYAPLNLSNRSGRPYACFGRMVDWGEARSFLRTVEANGKYRSTFLLRKSQTNLRALVWCAPTTLVEVDSANLLMIEDEQGCRCGFDTLTYPLAIALFSKDGQLLARTWQEPVVRESSDGLVTSELDIANLGTKEVLRFSRLAKDFRAPVFFGQWRSWVDEALHLHPVEVLEGYLSAAVVHELFASSSEPEHDGQVLRSLLRRPYRPEPVFLGDEQLDDFCDRLGGAEVGDRSLNGAMQRLATIDPRLSERVLLASLAKDLRRRSQSQHRLPVDEASIRGSFEQILELLPAKSQTSGNAFELRDLKRFILDRPIDELTLEPELGTALSSTASVQWNRRLQTSTPVRFFFQVTRTIHELLSADELRSGVVIYFGRHKPSREKDAMWEWRKSWVRRYMGTLLDELKYDRNPSVHRFSMVGSRRVERPFSPSESLKKHCGASTVEAAFRALDSRVASAEVRELHWQTLEKCRGKGTRTYADAAMDAACKDARIFEEIYQAVLALGAVR